MRNRQKEKQVSWGAQGWMYSTAEGGAGPKCPPLAPWVGPWGRVRVTIISWYESCQRFHFPHATLLMVSFGLLLRTGGNCASWMSPPLGLSDLQPHNVLLLNYARPLQPFCLPQIYCSRLRWTQILCLSAIKRQTLFPFSLNLD